MAKADDTGETGFPGYGWAEGALGMWVQGMKDVATGLNRMWEGATGKDDYSFSDWFKEAAGIYGQSYRSMQKAFSYSLSSLEGDRPVWAPFNVAPGSTTGASRWVPLPKSVTLPAPDATPLERLGADVNGVERAVPPNLVVVELNKTKDRIRVSLAGLTQDKNQKSKPFFSGTYVGFAKQPGLSGPPIAIIFVSFEDKP